MTAMPNAYRAAWLAVMPPLPGWASSGRSAVYSCSRTGSAVTTAAPATAPPTEPSPPITIITRYSTETSSAKDWGATLPMATA
jgi:hypothetical protein